jgi:predicted nucleotidyltransferase
MATVRLPPDFKEFLKLLNAHQVEYLLIGGYAVGYHGYPRATADMDIWIAMHRHNAEKVVTILKEFGFDVPELSADLFLKANQIIRMGVPPVRIEIATTISGVRFEECYAGRVVDELDGVEVNLISLKHLKINKKASGRHKDLDDLENLP